MHCEDKGRKRNEAVKSDLDRIPSGPEGRSRDVVCQKDGSSSPAAEAHAIFKQDDDEASYRKLRSF